MKGAPGGHVVTSLQFVSVLRRAGYVLTSVTEQYMVMSRDTRHVVVKRHQAFDEDRLAYLLLSAGLARGEFDRMLAEATPHVSGTMPRVDVDGETDEEPKAG
jgi:hypothetical protein